MRQHMKRFSRLTAGHSKNIDNHVHMVALYTCWYNFAGVYSSVRMSSAMAARVAGRLWDIGDIVKLIGEWGNTSMKRLLIIAISCLALTACLHDFRNDPPEQSQTYQVYKDKPIGAGDPAAISCYPSPSSMSRVKKLDCRHNSEWAQLAADEHRGGTLDIGNKAAGAAVNVTPSAP